MSLGIFARYEHRRGHGNERKLLRGEGEGRQCATMSPGACSSALRWYIQRTESPLHRAVRHCVGTFNVRNHRFTVDLSGARPRRWKSEFLSIESLGVALALYLVMGAAAAVAVPAFGAVAVRVTSSGGFAVAMGGMAVTIGLVSMGSTWVVPLRSKVVERFLSVPKTWIKIEANGCWVTSAVHLMPLLLRQSRSSRQWRWRK